MRAPEITRRAALTLALGAVGAAARAAQAPLPAASPWAAVDAAAGALVADHASPGVSVSVMKAGRLV